MTSPTDLQGLLEKHDGFTRWRVPFIARGAYGTTGGHVYLLGLHYAWGSGPFTRVHFEAWRLFAMERWKGERWHWAFASLSLTFKRASWRYHDRIRNRECRLARRRMNALQLQAKSALSGGSKDHG